MKTFHNATIQVTVSDEVVARYLGRAAHLARTQGGQTQEQVLRGLILSDAMAVLGNKSEVSILENDPITDQEIEDRAIELLTIEHLIEHCRYNVAKTLTRMNGGHGMSLGMSDDVIAAGAWARNELRTSRAESMEMGIKSIMDEREMALRYRRAKSNRDGFKIEIIGPMPEHIGLCRYQEA